MWWWISPYPRYAGGPELIALAEEKQRLLSVFHNRRWDSDYLGIRQMIEQGTLGAVKHFESHFDRFRPEVRVAGASRTSRAAACGSTWGRTLSTVRCSYLVCRSRCKVT